MKKLLLIGLTLVATILFVSCGQSLEGTTWKSTTDPRSMSEVTVVEFQETTFEVKVTYAGDPKSYDWSGTYTYESPTIKITVDGETTTGTIDGNTMESDGYTFTKQ